VDINSPTAIHSAQVYPWQQDVWQSLISRLAQGRLAHAYLLAGESGIGKTDFARAFAHYLLCHERSASAACGHCKACLLAAAGNHPDLFLAQAEEGSAVIKIEQIRLLSRFVQQTSHFSTSRVIILSPAEAMGPAAANALLKVLEEPPAETWFLVLSHQPGLLMPTVKSRCQLQPLPCPTQQQGYSWLQSMSSQSSEEDLNAALAISKNRPLAAWSALQLNLPEERRNLLVGLSQLLKAQLLPIELARRYEKADRAQILTLMQNTLASLIRFESSADPQYLYDAELLELAQLCHITPSTGRYQSKILHGLYIKMNNAIMQLRSSSNPNPLLILENCFIEWQRVMSTDKQSESQCHSLTR
jgi:DNA polymerase III subunit delta'